MPTLQPAMGVRLQNPVTDKSEEAGRRHAGSATTGACAGPAERGRATGSHWFRRRQSVTADRQGQYGLSGQKGFGGHQPGSDGGVWVIGTAADRLIAEVSASQPGSGQHAAASIRIQLAEQPSRWRVMSEVISRLISAPRRHRSPPRPGWIARPELPAR